MGTTGGGLEGGVEADRNKFFHSNIFSVPLLFCLLRLGKIHKEDEMYRIVMVSEKNRISFFFIFLHFFWKEQKKRINLQRLT